MSHTYGSYHYYYFKKETRLSCGSICCFLKFYLNYVEIKMKHYKQIGKIITPHALQESWIVVTGATMRERGFTYPILSLV